MQHDKIKILFFLGAGLFFGCSARDQLSRPIVHETFPELSAPRYVQRQNQMAQSSGTIVDGRFMFNNLIEVILHEPKKSIELSTKIDLIKQFERTNTILFLKDSAKIDMSSNFLKFMPRAYGRFDKPVYMTLENNRFLNNFSFNMDRKRIHQGGRLDYFDFHSNFFPQKFVFPIDIIDYQASGHNIPNYPLFDKKDYLILELPPAIILQTTYAENVLRFRRWYTQYSTGTSSNLHPVYDSTGYYGLSDKYLLLNPSFEYAYARSIKSIWELYLVGVKCENFKDTIVCIDDCNYGSILGRVFYSQRPYCKTGCFLNINSPNVLNYLSEAYDREPMLYQSYFELILWQMYQTGNFTAHDSKGKKRSYFFTSKNPKYPGNYEVKFNIYEPYEFKVRKR